MYMEHEHEKKMHYIPNLFEESLPCFKSRLYGMAKLDKLLQRHRILPDLISFWKENSLARVRVCVPVCAKVSLST